jgi:hypothetical protein
MSENEEQELIAPEPVAEPSVEPVAELVAEPSTESANEPVAEPAAEPSAEPTEEGVETVESVGEAGAESVAETSDEAVDAPKKRRKLLRRKPGRRVKSRTLFISAVVLGVLGGVGSGYAVQSSRPDTALPPLIPTQPQYAPVGIYAGIAPPQLPASEDDMTITDGDLTKLLLPTPAGATISDAWDHEYIGVVDNASTCDDQVSCFTVDMSDDVRAIADTGWTKSGIFEEIRIFRFAPQYQSDSWLQNVGSEGTLLNPPATLDAAAVETDDPSKGGYIDYGIATHGDLAVEFWVSSTAKAPNPSILNNLMTQQMARL